MGKILAKNKRAFFDYEIIEQFEAGIVLKGLEVKSIRQGQISLAGSYIVLKQSRAITALPSAWLINASIPRYAKASKDIPYDPLRSRQLLLKKSEIRQLIGQKQEKGLTAIPLTVYSKRGRIKISFGLGRGKKKYDKRQDMKKREDEAKIRRALRQKV